MKKIFMFGAAALMFAACSSDEAVKVNQGNEIQLRTNINWTRANDITTNTLAAFNATAINAETGSAYFENETFTRLLGGNTYASTVKHYWPETAALNFFAYAPVTSSQIAKTNYRTFTVTPSATVADQDDLIYANTNGKTKASNENGVVLNFRHAESKICAKVYNSDNTLTVNAVDWKIAYVSPTGTFTYANETAAGTDAWNNGTSQNLLLPFATWSDRAAASLATQYIAPASAINFDGAQTTPEAMEGEMILVPQQLTGYTGYDVNTVNAEGKYPLNGAYIAVKMTVANKADGTIIIGDKWCVWPISTLWEPGKKYTYVIDLGNGGYHEDDDDPNDPTPKPYLKPITFIDVTVDEWYVEPDIYIPAQP